MVILTAKLSKSKRIAILALLVIAAAVLVVCVHGSGKTDEAAAENELQASPCVKTDEDRIAYLNSFGWEVDAPPVQTQEVRVPTETNDIFARYNELQKSQGFDLEAYAGKSIQRYVYKITNYPNAADQTWFATLLVYKDEVIGADVSSSAQNGVMHGLRMPDNA
ncbi:MAG: DUF4830 domain-containing protein [Clostridia bacterium]|nr:DUF4830 domain-containing protein [Clostridia bacterium]